MKFVYEYRTSDNVPHRGVIAASTKEAAYDTLKAQGIKPGKVWEAPGIFNKVFGKGKRWIAIVVLLIVASIASAVAFRLSRTATDLRHEVDDRNLYEERGQLYGDPVLLKELTRDDWAGTFADLGDRYLSSFAVPCKFHGREWDANAVVRALEVNLSRRNAIADDDLREVAQMKRMVNGMRRELQQYVTDGGTVRGYVKKLYIRQKAEFSLYENVKRELSRETNVEIWREKNNELRAKGLPMVGTGDE